MVFGQVWSFRDLVFFPDLESVVVCQCDCGLKSVADLSAVPCGSVGFKLVIVRLRKLEDASFVFLGYFDIFSFLRYVIDMPFPDFSSCLYTETGVVQTHVNSRFESRIDCPYSVRCEEENPRVVLQDTQEYADETIPSKIRFVTSL